MESSFDLHGRRALVTGANTGIGQAIAIGLAGAGADVCAAGRTQPNDTRRAVEKLGRSFIAIEADFGAGAEFARVVAEAEASLGPLDILVNNAGTIHRADALELTEADWDAVHDVNLKAVFFLSQAFARRCVAAARPGKIVNIASMLSFQGGIRVAPYASSKSGLAGLTRALANEWAPLRINVNGIAPGYVSTNNTTALRNDETRSREILARIPAGRWGKPAEIAGAAVFLASAAADYVHGAILPVDGGWLAR
ncbi:MAG TPA: 2-dehydro-3-deoxy-D-gluconate 5-dehydrogenase KduD [Steroidobacteraceae bacterium]|nr:2-dehydro-3-deoxy-D-gluconate 5-dehydrogenase KduD [Steroidobacteraceae bacterium]